MHTLFELACSAIRTTTPAHVLAGGGEVAPKDDTVLEKPEEPLSGHLVVI